MASRKRSKGSKGKKASPPSSRSSLKGDEAPDAMPGLKEVVEAPASEFTVSTSTAKKSEKKGDKKGDKGGAGGDKPVVKPVAARAPPPRMVYFDPAKVLPSADKRTGPGGEKAEEQKLYTNQWLFTPATVLSAVDPEPGVVLIRTKDMEVHRVKGTDLETVNPQALEGVPDAMSVSNLTEASLLHTVRERYNRDEVYTRVGPVLMSINPYKWILGLYSEEAMLSYHGKAAMVEAGELAPHLFGVADHAYSQLVKGHLDADSETKEDVKARKAKASNQSIIISGESGSGKTEATKIIMQYLARITSSTPETRSNTSNGGTAAKEGSKASLTRKASVGGNPLTVNVGDLESRVLSCNPLLESFGNAVTLKNDNSSRFGKFIKIQFDKKGSILGAQIQNYLLEKTRIVAQAKRERSYHIFYQLLAGASSTVMKELKLEKGVAGFQCLKGSQVKDNDASDFEHTRECLAKIGIEEEGKGGQHGQDAILKLIAAIMHLLNVGFKSVYMKEGEACEIDGSTRPALDLAAELLGVEGDMLEKAMVSKMMAVHSTSTVMLQTVEQAHDKAAALGKALYSQLFLWLVAKLNTTISAPHSDVWGFIGVLDIYGFEKFNTNSLEQLLINYANEHLQRHFNQHMFEVEQIDYDKEQIDWSYITFNDNKACLELVDGKGGLFSLLDDIQRFEGKEANLKFLSSFKQKHGPPGGAGAGLRGTLAKAGSSYGAIAASPPPRRKAVGHPHFVAPRFDPDTSFGIRHYAGDVFYNVAKFNQKNRENLTADMKDLMACSSNELVVDVLKAGEQEEAGDDSDDSSGGTPVRGRGGAGGRTIRSKSIGIQFKESLADLMATISTTQPRYIRCVKPNPEKKSGRFDGEDVLLQLQYSGTMETIRIRQQGYALRELKDDFLKKYKVLQPEAMDLETLVAYLSNMLGASQRDWQIGTSKVFLRNSMSDKLNLMVELRRKCATRVIQRWAVRTRRRELVRSTLQPFLKKAVVILKYLRAAAYFAELLAKRRAATRMVRWYRLTKDRKRFVKIRTAGIVIQAYLRGRYFVVQMKIRKEFAESSLPDSIASLEDCKTKLAALMAAMKYSACPPLVTRVHHLEIVVKEKAAAEERRKALGVRGRGGSGDKGVSREEIDIRVVEAQWRMKDAEAEQDYSLCTRLQRDIKELEALREQTPTLAELKDKAKSTKADIDKCAAAAEYGRAGSLQVELVSMEAKIKVMEEEADAEVNTGSFSDMSQKELEDFATKTREELETAKTQKDFAKCIELQTRLSDMKVASESMPTLEQVEGEVLAAEAEMASAKARKDYRRAAELSAKLPAMHDRHSAVASSTRNAMGRKQLAEEVQRLEGEMRLAKAEKRFSKCSLLQRSLLELQTIMEGLPSVFELEEEICDVSSRMDKAVSQQHYAEAEQFRVRLKELAEEKALAAEKEQHVSPKDSLGKDNSEASLATQFIAADNHDEIIQARPRMSVSERTSPEFSAMERGISGRDTSPAPPPPPPAPAGAMPGADSEELNFSSPKPVRVKQAPASLTPATPARPVRVAATPPVRVAAVTVATVRPAVEAVVKPSDSVSVSRLRPKPAVTMPENATVADVCKALANARSDSALLTGTSGGGGMTGIVTAIDLTRRVVAVGVDPDVTAVSEVMTPNPTSVSTDDSAMEALGIMVERHFRHLPVRGAKGEVTGVLDIAKCLYDAVTRLQRVAERKSIGGDDDGGDELKMSMLKELGKGKGKKSKAAMQAIMAKMFEDEGNAGCTVSLTLRQLLEEKGQPQIVLSTDTVRTAGKAIARGRKAVLVVDDDGLAGIFTEKDLLNRVLAKGRNPDTVVVTDVMTPNPDTVSSNMTVLEALQEMHENKYLHLPVVDESTGTVLGAVNVMEIIQATAGEQGSTGWKALFGSGFEASDDFSDSASQASIGSVATRASTRAGRGKNGPRVSPSVASTVKNKDATKTVASRPVSVLKPKPPLCLPNNLTVLEVAKRMADVRTDAAILLDSHGHLEGIITDNDVARRVVAKRLDASTTAVSEVMTPHPTMVHMDDSALDCLGIMIEKHFRHLPVVDNEENVAGLLNIAKCLYDAIHRLEKRAMKAEEDKQKGGGGDLDLAASVLQAAGSGKGKGKAKDLRAALAMLLADNTDGEHAEPTLGGILSEQTTSFVDGSDSVTAAAAAIAKGKKAVLVLDEGHLAGIVTPKDLLMRVVAKGLDPDATAVSDIMTPNPDTVVPEMTVVEALREMHENKYLHLPVVDEDEGTVVGVVNVMEIVQATAGAKGSTSWEAFFGSAMDAGDDVSDSASMYSVDRSVRSVRQRGGGGGLGVPRAAVAASVAGSVSKKPTDHRPVSTLKPKPPLCVSVELSVGQVAKKMAEIRTDAVILLGLQGDMKGIMTDHDIARKVVGMSLDPNRTPVASIMTPNPTWVNAHDSAMDALATMLEKHFRHLPVVDDGGAVTGLLNIAKCLYDAIHRLEKKAARAEEQGGSGETHELAASLLKLHAQKAKKGGRKNGKMAVAAMAQLLQGLSDGEEEPTLGGILSEQKVEFADEADSVSTAGKAIARSKKAVLVLREGHLTGIVTPKDLLMRVVAKGLDPDSTAVSDIMTPNPDTVAPEMTVVEALREMHENKYLHLPVVDESDGTVVGVVSVMEIIQATAGDRGSSRWEAFFGDAMDAGDDVSDSASIFSVDKSVRSVRPRGGGGGGGIGVPKAGATASVSGMSTAKASRRNDKPVSSLRPKRPIVMSCDMSVLEVATEMSLKRTDAALLMKRGRVAGIITDHDLTRRVIAFDKSPDRTAVRDVMTADPTMVGMDESAMEALGLMLRNKTRHLPVVDPQGKVTGLLDIAKCLYDAVHRLEKAAKKKAEEEDEGGGGGGGGNVAMLGAVMEAAKSIKGKATARNQQALQELLMLAMSGAGEGREGERQTLADVLASKEKAQFVRPRHTVREAASVIASQKKAVLVVEEGELVGIFTPKDMMNRVITKKLSPSTTAVSSVMTPNPDGGAPSMTVIEALQQMCENRYLHLPVVDEGSGEVMGVVDVMEIIEATVGQEGSAGWESFFGSAMEAADDFSDTMSQTSLRSRRSLHSMRPPGTPSVGGGGLKTPAMLPPGSAPRAMAAAAPPSVGRRASVRGGEDMPMARVAGGGAGMGDDGMSDASRDVGGLELEGWDEKFVYKVNDDAGHLYKFKASAEKLDSVLLAVSEKLKMPKDAILLKYQDDDGDQIVLSGDESLHEAVDMARASSAPSLKLVASLKLPTLQEDADGADDDSAAKNTPIVKANTEVAGASMAMIGIGVGVVAGIALLVITLSRSRR